MADDQKRRLYQRVVERADNDTLLDRMRLHGFWPWHEGLPQDPPEESAERHRLEAEIARLRKQHAAVKNPEAELEKERRRRREESKRRRAAAKAAREKAAEERRRRDAERKRTSIVHIGDGVSAGLGGTHSDADKLRAAGLPVMNTGADLAAFMGVELKALKWLAYHRKGAAVVHYHRYAVAKKTGGVRNISAPKPALKAAQAWVFENILKLVPTEDAAHGFVAGRSVVSNAAPHAASAVVVNMDLKDFFPSITFRRVKGLFACLGYGEHVATVLSLLCTEPPRVTAELDGRVFHVALGERVLPQGACTSPAITNILCRRLDRRLKGVSTFFQFQYTRYADDLTFSGGSDEKLSQLVRLVREVIEGEGFTENRDKTRVMRRGARQEVTGVVVNARPTVSRREVRLLRAILHNAARHGLESQNRDGLPNFAEHLRGRIEFVRMVDPAKAEPLLAAWRELHG